MLDEIVYKTKLRVEAAKKAMPFEVLRGLTGNKEKFEVRSEEGKVRSEEGKVRSEELEVRNTALLTPNTSPLTSNTLPLTPNSSLLTPNSPDPPFEHALKQPALSFICEVKRASPSKGIIAEDFRWLEIAKEYEAGGAAAISVLTEPEYFLGSDRYLEEIAAAVSIPVLRKDFIIDLYQIYEAKALGAQAVLLICAILDVKTLALFIAAAAELGLSALVEIHTRSEAEQAVEAGARIIGINNRDLKTFKVDIDVCASLRKCIPADILTVAESGIKTPEDIRILNNLDFDAVLVGECLMRRADKKQFLETLKGLKDIQ